MEIPQKLYKILCMTRCNEQNLGFDCFPSIHWSASLCTARWIKLLDPKAQIYQIYCQMRAILRETILRHSSASVVRHVSNQLSNNNKNIHNFILRFFPNQNFIMSYQRQPNRHNLIYKKVYLHKNSNSGGGCKCLQIAVI